MWNRKRSEHSARTMSSLNSSERRCEAQMKSGFEWQLESAWERMMGNERPSSLGTYLSQTANDVSQKVTVMSTRDFVACPELHRESLL